MNQFEFPITKPINNDLLSEELRAAVPAADVEIFMQAYFEQDADSDVLSFKVNADLTPEEVVLIEKVIATHDPSKLSERQKLKDAVVDIARSAVGLKINDLTAAQVKAMVAVLLYKNGAVGNDLRVNPLSEWLG